MGNFEKLSVLVIVVIIVMILVVALYTWTEKPSDDTELAKASADTELPIGSGEVDPRPDVRVPPIPDPSPADVTPSGEGEVKIELPDDLPDLPRIGDEPEVVKDPAAEVVAVDDEPWVYTIQKGDIFSRVCEREIGGYWKNLAQLKTLNPGVDFDHVQIGQQITMPPRGGGAAEVPSGSAVAVEPRGGGGTPGGEYVVQKGDSLKSIAKRVYGDWTVWPRIYAKNLTKITNPDYPTPGTRLTLPSR